MNSSNSTKKQIDAFIVETIDTVSTQDIFITDTAAIDLEQLIDEISDLVSLPEIYLRIRELMDDPDSRLDDFAKVVSTDPALTANVLKIVNSAFFGFAGQIENITRALNMIVIGQLHNLVLSIAAIDSLSNTNEIIEMRVFWRRSVYCGVLSRLLGDDLQAEETGSLFIIGLLHEIGHLILYQKYPKESRQAILLMEQENQPLYQAEQQIFGVHYGQVGQELMKKWNLPDKFQIVTGCHPEAAMSEQFPLEATIISLAHDIAQARDSDDPGTLDQMPDYDQEIIAIAPEKMQLLVNLAEQMSMEMEKMILR